MINSKNTKKEVYDWIDLELKRLAKSDEQEHFSRFCFLANQVMEWEKDNQAQIKKENRILLNYY